jgi:hypothetical protein
MSSCLPVDGCGSSPSSISFPIIVSLVLFTKLNVDVAKFVQAGNRPNSLLKLKPDIPHAHKYPVNLTGHHLKSSSQIKRKHNITSAKCLNL